MALLDLCQAVAAEIPVVVPASIIGNAEQTAALILAAAQKAGEDLARKPQRGWVAQVVEYTFTTNGASDYPLPADFGRLVDGTLWDRGRFWALRGPLSPGEWQRYKSSALGAASPQRRWRIRLASGQAAGSSPVFSLDPAVTDTGDTLVFEYVSTAWCKSSSGTPQQAWKADTDLPMLDPYLVRLGILWRTLNRLGLSYGQEKMDYDAAVDMAMARDGGSADLSLVPPVGGVPLMGPWNIPETGYGR